MSNPDSLASMLAPNSIAKFDQIPPHNPLNIEITKGDLALLIKSQYQLHQGLSNLLQAVNLAVFTDEGRTYLNAAFQALQDSQGSFAHVGNDLINRTVHQAGREGVVG